MKIWWIVMNNENFIKNIPPTSKLFIPKSCKNYDFLPVDYAAFDGYFGEIVADKCNRSAIHPVQLQMALFSMLGTAVGNQPHIFIKNPNKQYLKGYFLHVADTSNGLKTITSTYVSHLFKHADENMVRGNKIAGHISSGQAIVTMARDITLTEEQKELSKELSELEQIKQGLRERKVVTIVNDEISSLFRLAADNSSILSPILRQVHDGDGGTESFSVSNKMQLVTGSHISILGATTPSDLLRDLSKAEYHNGFLNRFMIYWAQATKSDYDFWGDNEAAITAKDYEHSKQIKIIIEKARDIHELRFDSEAQEYWREIAEGLEEDKIGVGDIIARRRLHVIRLSMYYAITDLEHIMNYQLNASDNWILPIKINHVKSAKAMVDYCTSSVYKLFGDSMVGTDLGNRYAEKLYQRLKVEFPNGLSQTEISQGVFQNNIETEAEANKIYKLLEQHQLVRKETKSTGGRDQTIWYAQELN